MAILFLRCIILYLLTLVAVKVMGKRQVAQLQPFDLVVILIISDMASLCMQNKTNPVLYSIVPILTLTLLQVLFSLFCLKSERFRHIVCGRPTPLIEKGEVKEGNLRWLRISINDLQELCRSAGYFDFSGIEYAVLETNGSFSILPRTEKRPLQVEDLLADDLPEESMPYFFVLDGRINPRTLQKAGFDERWLKKQLAEKGFSEAKDVFVAGIDETGVFFAQQRTGEGKE